MTWAQPLKRVFNIDIVTKRGVRRGDAHHRLHRGCGGDREDPRPPRCESSCSSALPAAAVPGAARAAVRLRRSPSVFPCCAVDSRPRQAIGCAQGAAPSASRRRRTGASRAEALAGVTSRTKAGPAGLRRRFASLWTERGRSTKGRGGRFIRLIHSVLYTLCADAAGYVKDRSARPSAERPND